MYKFMVEKTLDNNRMRTLLTFDGRYFAKESHDREFSEYFEPIR